MLSRQRLLAKEGPHAFGPAKRDRGYAEEAERLVKQYESISFSDVHRQVFHLIPSAPSRILDTGSGTGRDAAGFAAMGHRVTAVEPTVELRLKAAALHPSPRIEWIDDSLPDLPSLVGHRFDMVMLTAVWMHLDEQQREQSMRRIAALVDVGGVMSFSLRYGPIPQGRRMFVVSADETVRLAEAEGLNLILRFDNQDGLLGRPGVRWTRLAFRLGQLTSAAL